MDDDLLDRVDEIGPPGTDIGALDQDYLPPALQMAEGVIEVGYRACSGEGAGDAGVGHRKATAKWASGMPAASSAKGMSCSMMSTRHSLAKYLKKPASARHGQLL